MSVRASPIFVLLFAANGVAAGLDGLASRAEVTGPRGSFVTEMVSLSDGTTRFVQIYPPNDPKGRSRVELVVAGGKLAFRRDAKGTFVPADPGTSSFVLGHDAVRLAFNKGTRPTRLSSPGPTEMGGGIVTIELADYRKHIGLELPFSATFVHSAAPKDRYVYRYTELLPFRIAPGSPSPGGPTNPAPVVRAARRPSRDCSGARTRDGGASRQRREAAHRGCCRTFNGFRTWTALRGKTRRATGADE